MIDGVNANINPISSMPRVTKSDTITVKEPKTYEKYEYEVEIDGKKQTAKVEKAPDDTVTIQYGEGDEVKTLVTDKEGLRKFNQKYMKPDVLYSAESKKVWDNPKEDEAKFYSKAMKSLVFANLALQKKMAESLDNSLAVQNQLNLQMQNDLIQNQILQQQAEQAHMTAVQTANSGMGIV